MSKTLRILQDSQREYRGGDTNDYIRFISGVSNIRSWGHNWPAKTLTCEGRHTFLSFNHVLKSFTAFLTDEDRHHGHSQHINIINYN